MAVRLTATLLMPLMVTLFTWGLRAEPATKPVLEVGAAMPHFLLTTANPDACGLKVFATKKLVGSRAKEPRKALVLSFVASWCKPCRKELPELRRAETRLRKKGVLLAVVDVDEDDEAYASMRKWMLDELKLGFPVMRDQSGIVGRRYGANELPFMVVVDGDGRVQWFRTGYDEGRITEMEAAVGRVVSMKGKGSRK